MLIPFPHFDFSTLSAFTTAIHSFLFPSNVYIVPDKVDNIYPIFSMKHGCARFLL